MSEKTMSEKLEGFDAEEAPKIAGFVSQEIANSMVEKLLPLIKNELYRYVANEPIIHMKSLQEAGMPNVLLRLQTVHLLFDGFLRMLTEHISRLYDTAVLDTNLSFQTKLKAIYSITGKELVDSQDIDNVDDKEAARRINDIRAKISETVRYAVYSPNLRRMGTEVGLSFALNLMSFIVNEKKRIPYDYEALLSLWDSFDSATDMGDFSFHLDRFDGIEFKDYFEVVINNSFLTKGRLDDKHRHCAFFEGYLTGVLDGIFLIWTRLFEFKKSRLQSPKYFYQILSVNEDDTSNDKCFFKVNVGHETFPEVRTLLARAIYEYWSNSMVECCTFLRLMFENALKKLLELSSSPEIDFMKTIDQLYSTKALKEGETNELKDIYKRLQELIKNADKMDRSRPGYRSYFLGLIHDSWRIIRTLPSSFTPRQLLDYRKIAT